MNFEDLKDEGRLLAINKIIIESGDYESNMDSLNQNRYFIPIKDFYRLVDKFALLVNDDWNDPNLEYTEVPAPGNMKKVKIEEVSALQKRINIVCLSLKHIELLNGSFVLREAIKQFVSVAISKQEEKDDN